MKRFVPFVLSLTLVLALAPPISAATTKKTTKKPTTSPTTSTTKSKSAPKKSVPEAPAVDANGVPRVSAGSAIVVDAATGKVLARGERRPAPPGGQHAKAAHRADRRRRPAISMKRCSVEASDTWAEPTKLYIKPGETYTRRDFLNILLVKSMNDVARALARDNAGSVEAFAEKMNARAAQMGMHESQFRQSERPAGARPVFDRARHGAHGAGRLSQPDAAQHHVPEVDHLALQRRTRRRPSATRTPC